jgi:hypothetical protein
METESPIPVEPIEQWVSVADDIWISPSLHEKILGFLELEDRRRQEALPPLTRKEKELWFGRPFDSLLAGLLGRYHKALEYGDRCQKRDAERDERDRRHIRKEVAEAVK